MPRVLLLGANGQVGHALRHTLQPLGEVIALTRESLDASDLPAVRAAVDHHAPAVIVNAVAYTAVDQAEREPALAHRLNAELPEALAQAARAHDAWLVHYSSDYVYDGRKTSPYREDDAPAPASVYGHTKLAGDVAVQAWARHLVLRTSWVHGTHGGNFARTMLRLAAERDRLSVVDDQVGAPTGAERIAQVTAQALAAALTVPDKAGLYHLAAAGETTWCGYARHVIAQGLAHGMALRCTPDAVQGIPTEAYPTPAARPANSRLDTQRLQQAFGLALPEWRVDVDATVAHLARRG